MTDPNPTPPVDNADQPKRNPLISLVMNALMVYFLYSNTIGKKARPVVDDSSSTPLINPELTASATSSPLPSTTSKLDDPFGISNFMETLKESSSGRRRVATELQAYEDERLARAESISKTAPPLKPLWTPETPFEIFVYLSDRADPISRFHEDEPLEISRDSVLHNVTFEALAEEQVDASKGVSSNGADAPHSPPLLWHIRGFKFGVEYPTQRQFFNISTNAALRQNASVYAHIYFAARGASIDPDSPLYRSADVIRHVYPMVKYLKQRPKKQTFSLLGEDASAGDKALTSKRSDADKNGSFGFGFGIKEEEEEIKETANTINSEADTSSSSNETIYLSYWRPTLHLQLVTEFGQYVAHNLPPHMKVSLDAEPALNGYRPFTYINDFWLLNHHLVGPLNETALVVPLEISFSYVGQMRWAMQSQVQASWDAQSKMGTSQEGDSDMLKSIIVDANPVLLAVTVIVSMLHMVFEFLAFKNDISFWRAAKSMEGLSVRSITVNFVQMLIIALYLFENETSWMILFSQVIGLGIEAWKLSKAFAVSIKWGGPGNGLRGWIPQVDFADRDANYATSRTKEYDDIATHHMLVVLLPLVMGYATYSLVYERHRSWYSWLLTSAVNYVYLFGFVQLVPQLYINYRLKSVAHLPQRAYMYKFLTTIIDDLFAFVIKMPTLHRIAVFRDDVIFVMLIIQRYQYPVDKTRKNEYGTSGLDEELKVHRLKGLPRKVMRDKYAIRQLPKAI
jgi:hypothetical protein